MTDTQLKNNRRTDEHGQITGCDHTGGSLLAVGGTWVGAAEGDTSKRLFQCFECGDLFEVTRKNIETKRVTEEALTND